jgi:hypothetical protein
MAPLACGASAFSFSDSAFAAADTSGKPGTAGFARTAGANRLQPLRQAGKVGWSGKLR